LYSAYKSKESLGASVAKRCVFRDRLKEPKESPGRRSPGGRSFHSRETPVAKECGKGRTDTDVSCSSKSQIGLTLLVPVVDGVSVCLCSEPADRDGGVKVVVEGVSVCLCSEPARQSDWDGIVACHRGDVAATTWNFHRCTMGSHRLQHRRFTDDHRLRRRAAATARYRLLTYCTAAVRECSESTDHRALSAMFNVVSGRAAITLGSPHSSSFFLILSFFFLA